MVDINPTNFTQVDAEPIKPISVKEFVSASSNGTYTAASGGQLTLVSNLTYKIPSYLESYFDGDSRTIIITCSVEGNFSDPQSYIKSVVWDFGKRLVGTIIAPTYNVRQSWVTTIMAVASTQAWKALSSYWPRCVVTWDGGSSWTDASQRDFTFNVELSFNGSHTSLIRGGSMPRQEESDDNDDYEILPWQCTSFPF